MKSKKVNRSRRSFLRRAAQTGVAAGAASISLDTMATVVPNADEPERKEDGYQLSDHVQAYYKSQTR